MTTWAIISPQLAKSKVESGALLVDVRTPLEFSKGHVSGAINISHEQVPRHLDQFGTDRAREIVLYCAVGARSGMAQKVLVNAGFENVFNAGSLEDLLPVFPE